MTARYPDIPRRQIAGIGNVLRHDCDLVDQRITWEVAKVHFPRLRVAVAELGSELPKED
jgi:uncharacterized protein with HEPN domain